MKLGNEALQTVRRHGVEYTLWCLGLKSAEVFQYKESDPETFARIMAIRKAMQRQLAINSRNVSYED